MSLALNSRRKHLDDAPDLPIVPPVVIVLAVHIAVAAVPAAYAHHPYLRLPTIILAEVLQLEKNQNLIVIAVNRAQAHQEEQQPPRMSN